MVKLDVVALVTAVATALGGFLTAILNYLHGRDDARGFDKFISTLEKQAEQQTKHTSEVTMMLNDKFTRTSEMLEKLIMLRRSP
jgi:hypothetical protein